MRILNRTESDASYELKGGPLRMTMSTCLLAPGEEEVWTSPYRKHGVAVTCEVHVEVGGVTRSITAPEDATVVVEPAEEGFRLALG